MGCCLQGSYRTWKTWKNKSRPRKPGKTGGFGAKTWKNITQPRKKIWPHLEETKQNLAQARSPQFFSVCLDKGLGIIGFWWNFKNVVLIWRTHFKLEYWGQNKNLEYSGQNWGFFFQFITNKSGWDQLFCIIRKQSLPKISDNSSKNINLYITLKKINFDQKFVLSFFSTKFSLCDFICFRKREDKAYKKDQKILGKKTFITWKNHGKIMEFCWSAAVGTLCLGCWGSAAATRVSKSNRAFCVFAPSPFVTCYILSIFASQVQLVVQGPTSFQAPLVLQSLRPVHRFTKWINFEVQLASVTKSCFWSVVVGWGWVLSQTKLFLSFFQVNFTLKKFWYQLACETKSCFQGCLTELKFFFV